MRQGYIDQICPKTYTVFGWVLDEGGRDRKVDLYVNGQFKRSVFTDRTARPDLIDAGLMEARVFHFSFQADLDAEESEIDIRFSGTAQTIPNGKMVLYTASDSAVDDYWSNFYMNQPSEKLRWWQCDKIVQHINKKVCGKSLGGLSTGLYDLVRNRYAENREFHRGISVGCGQGSKEFDLMQFLPVHHFDLYELSKHAVESGTERAMQLGLGSRVNFQHANAFKQEDIHEKFDLIMWNNALHHMPDVDKALEWSRHILKPEGLLIMDDFVGPTRMQFPQWVLDHNSKLRKETPKKHLQNPLDPNECLSTVIQQLDEKALIRHDPSECADSSRILEFLKVHFPKVEIIPTGGAAYHLGLNDILHNIIEDEDWDELNRWLKADDDLIAQGETHYAVAIAEK